MPSVANNLLTISMITKESLRVLENNLVLFKHVNREYDDSFAVEGAKIGTTLNVRKPPRYVGRTGQALKVEESIETQVPLTLDTQFGVDIEFSSADLALSIDEFGKRFLVPAMAVVANKIDSDLAALYYQIWNAVGTPGVVPADLITYLLAGVDLDNNACPKDGQRGIFMTPYMQAYIVDALKGLFEQSKAIAQQYETGMMGVAAGFDWYMDQNMATHTVGTYGGTPLINGAAQVGASLITDGWTATTTILNVGDMFTLAGVYSVNPQSRQSTGQLQKFVVTAQTTTDGSGNSTISIAPSIVVSGAYQTVSASPADNAAITMRGASGAVSPQGLAIHKDCMTFASADLPVPRGVDMAGNMADDQLGVSVRIARAWDINTDQFPCRIDILYGVAMLRPELGCRVCA